MIADLATEFIKHDRWSGLTDSFGTDIVSVCVPVLK